MTSFQNGKIAALVTSIALSGEAFAKNPNLEAAMREHGAPTPSLVEQQSAQPVTQQKAPTLNITRASRAADAIVASSHGGDVQDVVDLIARFPDRFRVDTGANQSGSVSAEQRKNVEEIRKELTKELPDGGMELLKKATPEQRKVLAPYILGAQAAEDSALIKGAIARSEDLKGVMGAILTDARQRSGKHAEEIAIERLHNGAVYYNLLEKPTAAAALDPAKLERTMREQVAKEKAAQQAASDEKRWKEQSERVLRRERDAEARQLEREKEALRRQLEREARERIRDKYR